MIHSSSLNLFYALGVRTLKREPGTTVEVIGREPDALVVKTYHNRGLRRLQTFCQRSRAARECSCLRRIAAAGIPCPETVGWMEIRRWGMVVESTVVTRLIPDATTLKATLQRLDRRQDWRQRARLAEAAGRLLGLMHRQGLFWGTPMPRNILVVGDAAAARLAVCDPPRCLVVQRSLVPSRLAKVDIHLAAFSANRRREYSATERLRWLRSYATGDDGLVRRLWRAMARRPVALDELVRAAVTVWHRVVLRTPLLGRAASTAP